MWPSRHLLSSVAVQALGAAATFGVGIAIAAVQGPAAQGRYGLLRAAADLLLALALFGLPQSMVHALNQRGASAQGLLRMGLRYAAVLGAVIVGAVLAFGAAGPGLPQWLGSPLALLALLAGTLGWVVQGLLRAFALCRGTAVQFAWLSVMPALTLLVAVAGLLVGGSQRYEWAIAASGVASAVLALASLRPLRASRAGRTAVQRHWRGCWAMARTLLRRPPRSPCSRGSRCCCCASRAPQWPRSACSFSRPMWRRPSRCRPPSSRRCCSRKSAARRARAGTMRLRA